MDNEKIRVELVYAEVDRSRSVVVDLTPGTDVATALKEVRATHAEFGELDTSQVGVFGVKVSGDYRLQDGDRLEIYRPLLRDPKTRRRDKAQKSQKAQN